MLTPSKILTSSKFALAVVLVLGATFSASAKTTAVSNTASGYDSIPGYSGDGATVPVPNPDRR
ncbi:MAG TPA: hypothetical protein VH206_05030 [Xanthobacteraceae bacterium]|jgi:hypothetical protein|nr:hypothetical protein [Xanthobacteraceae bacterium]